MDPGRLLAVAAWLALVPAGALAAEPVRRPAHPPVPEAPRPGRPAIAAALRAATQKAQAARFEDGVQVFAYAPGRIYEVWTAPLRVSGLTLSPGERVTALAAGDTVRWQIGQTTSGEGESQRVHVLVKPLSAGLTTDLVLSTDRRVYVVILRSGSPEAFNPLVAWTPEAAPPEPAPAPPGLARPAQPPGELDARYRIVARGGRPAWTPLAVMTDGRRTLIAFPPSLAAGEAPALFAIGPGGEAQMVNYRQKDGLFVVDRVLDRAELRLGDRHPQVVSLVHQSEDRP